MTPKTKKNASHRVHTHASTPARAEEKASRTAMKYVLPSAVLAGAALVTTAGLLLNKQLAAVLRGASRATLAQGTSVLAELDLAKLLGHVGLQRRRSALLGPVVGAAAGVLVGAALTFWVAPALVPRLRAVRDPSTHPPSVNGVSTGPTVSRDHPPTTDPGHGG
jgi:hypothetical protein